MTTASDLITGIFREGNLIPIGKTPSADQQAEALGELNRYIFGLLGTTLGEFLRDWNTPPSRTAPVSARFPLLPQDDSLPSDVWPYPPDNVRLVTRLTEATTVYLPFRPEDGSMIGLADVGSGLNELTLDANGKLIEGAQTLTFAPEGDPQIQWLYRSDLGSWQRLDMVDLTSESPLPFSFDNLLITGVAMRLSSRFGQDARETTMQENARQLKRLKLRYTQTSPRPGKWGEPELSDQSFSRGVGRERRF